MKIITLNIWGGHVFEPLLEFTKANQDVDIFCLQEVYSEAKEKISTEDRKVSLNILSEMNALLPEHRSFFRPVVDSIYGVAMLVKTSIQVIGEGEITIHENPNYKGRGPTHSRNLQWISCQRNERSYTIANVHGLWNGMGKADTPERISQSKKIQDFLATIKTPIILCGDFNLKPNTESIKVLETGMKNLIQEYKVISTRTRLYTKEERFADYVFVSPDVQIKRFEVLKDEVSDHCPLYLEID